jgi:Zn-dependent M16 (insulinase) family peptidase
LKGIDAQDAGRVEQLIVETLRSLVEDGIDPDMVAASLNTVEFQLREANTGGFPRGLMYMLEALSPWQHGGDPIASLAFEAPLAGVKSGLAENPRYFEELIARHLLQNSHRSVVLLQPDSQARQRTEAAEQRRLQQARAAMDEEDLRVVQEDMQRLQELQDRPDSPEAVATIPSLSLADLDKANKLIPIEVSEAQGATVLFHDLFTNGILYLDVGFDLKALPQDYLPYAGLFGRLLLGMGTDAQDYVKLSQRIGRETGGIRASTLTRNTRSGDAATWFMLRGKATADNATKLLDILRDVLLTARLDNRERLRQIVLEDKAGLESGLVPSGHSFVYGRLSAGFTEADWVGEQIDGVDYLFFLRRLAQRIDQDWPGVLSDLETVRRYLVNRQGMLCNVTLDRATFQRCQSELGGFIASLPASSWQPAAWRPKLTRPREGLAIPAQVNYVGQGANLYALGYQLQGSSLVAVNFLNNTWFWDKVRVQGGAYGGFCLFDNLSGVLGYLSYRDPNLLATLQVYDETAAYLRQADLGRDAVEKVIIGVIGRMDSYMLPDAKGYTSMVRHLTGDTDEFRQVLRDQVLATAAKNLRQFAEVLEQVREKSAVVVMGSEQAIATANESLSPRLTVTKLM